MLAINQSEKACKVKFNESNGIERFRNIRQWIRQFHPPCLEIEEPFSYRVIRLFFLFKSEMKNESDVKKAENVLFHHDECLGTKSFQ